MADLLFFGVVTGHGAGHHLWASSPMRWVPPTALPLALQRLDAVWTAPSPRSPDQVRDRWRERGPETEGMAYLHHVEGWTVVAWWDRSEDHRGGSNAAFLARGTHTLDAMLALARRAFPREMRRMEASYTIRPYSTTDHRTTPRTDGGG